MAGSSMKDIKRRVKSVESTMQITKAMELVASSKLRRAKERVERSRPFYTILYQTLAEIAETNLDFSSVYTQKRPVKNACFIVIAGDRGLAGGYNSNVLKLAESEMAKIDAHCKVVPVGKKALEYFTKREADIVCDTLDAVDEIGMGTSAELARMISQMFIKGEIDELYIVYTNFVSTLSQVPAVLRLLPLISISKSPKKGKSLTVFEPGPSEAFSQIVPQYLAGVFYGAVCESLASEQGARRTAMEAANDNAKEMIDNLSLSYNRARQAAITQEITEIAAGAQALE